MKLNDINKQPRIPTRIHLNTRFNAAPNEGLVWRLTWRTALLPLPYSTERQLRWRDTRIIYTDGSAKDGYTGGGVVIPSDTLGEAAIEHKVLSGKGNSFKAELAALTHALRISSLDKEVWIASDCQSAMTAIEVGSLTANTSGNMMNSAC